MKIYDYNGKKNICGDRLREARVVRRLRQEDLAAQIQLKGINMERDSISRTNENINKMIRRFLPKGTDFRKVTAAYIQRVETWINNYPREILGFETSGSLFERYVAEAT